MKRFAVLLFVGLLLVGCASIPSVENDMSDIPPLSAEVSAYISQMTQNYGAPVILDNYPVVIMRWDIPGPTSVTLYLALDPVFGLWVYAVYETLDLTEQALDTGTTL